MNPPADSRRASRAVALAAAAAMLTAACVRAPSSGPAPSAAEWATATAASAGLDPVRLSSLAGRAERGDFGEVTSILVVRRGALALERYYRGAGPDDLHRLASVTKGVTSIVVGLAWDSGLVRSLDTPVAELLPECADLFAADPRKRAITLEHVLTMTAGLAWDERSPPEPPEVGADWVRVVLSQPLVDPPGSRFRYSSGSTLILGRVLERLYGVGAVQVAARGLLQPLGVQRYHWASLEDGTLATGTGLALRPRDLAKVGQLLLDGGMFRGRRVVSAEWVRRSTARHVGMGDGGGYGYLWRRFPETDSGGRPSAAADVFYASGFGEQYLFVLPSDSMVVVVTAENLERPRIRPLEFVVREILPLVDGGR